MNDNLAMIFNTRGFHLAEFPEAASIRGSKKNTCVVTDGLLAGSLVAVNRR